MRSLSINQTQLWYVRPNGYTDILDDDGNKTGEKDYTYDGPHQILLTLYPVNGVVLKDSGGKFLEIDYTATSTEVALSKNDLLFKTEPVGDFDTTYDMLVKNILPSLNSYTYLLESRV